MRRHDPNDRTLPTAVHNAATAQSGMLLMAHGSKDPDGQAELHALQATMKAAAGRRPVALGALEYPSALVPAIAAAADLVAATGVRRIVAVPVLLLQAGHGKLDMPQQFALARARYPDIRWLLAPPLLPHPLLRAIVQERRAAALAAGGWSTDTARPAGPVATLLVGRGSHDPSANSDLFKIARLFAEEFHQPLVEACFISQTAPGVPEGIARCVALGASAIVVVPYFLHTGVLVQRISAQVGETQKRYPNVPLLTASHLGNHRRLIRLLLLRAREALLGVRAVPCLAAGALDPRLLPIIADTPTV